MKKTTKLLAAMTASLLALTPLAATGMTAFAADPTYNITVNSTKAADSEFEANKILMKQD